MANQFANKFQQGLTMGQGLMDMYEKAQMRKELKEANAMAPEQQTLGLNAPAEGAVPTGYEDYLTRDTQTGAFRPTANAETNPEAYAQQGIMAERFNAPGAFAGQRTSYSLGGVNRETPFSPEDVARARMERKAEIYSNYGREDLAEQMRTNALTREATGLQIKKAKSDLAKEEAFEKDKSILVNESKAALGALDRAKALLARGDRAGAARELIGFRSGAVGDTRLMRLNENGLMEGSEDGGATWVQSKGDNNVYNPGVVEKMMGEIDNTINDRFDTLLKNHADKKDLMTMRAQIKDEAYKERALDISKAELAQKERQFKEGLISAKELQEAKIKADKDIANAEGGFKITAAKITASRSAYPSMALQGSMPDGTPVYFDQHGGGMFTAGGKKLTDAEAKTVNLTNKATGDRAQVVPPAEAWKSAVDDVDSDPATKGISAQKRAELIRNRFSYYIGETSAGGNSTAAAADTLYGGKKSQTDTGLKGSNEPAKVNTSNWSMAQGALVRNPQAVVSAINSARESGEPVSPDLLSVAAYLHQQNPGILDKGVTGNRNTTWLFSQLTR